MTIKNFDNSKAIKMTNGVKSAIQMIGNSVKATYHHLTKGDFYPENICIYKDVKGYNINVKGRLRGWLSINEYHYDSNDVKFEDFLNLIGENATLEKRGTEEVISIDLVHKDFFKKFSTYWSDVVIFYYESIKGRGIEPENDEVFISFYKAEKALFHTLVYYNS